MKQCNRCKEYKDLTEFHKCKSKPDGHNSECKACGKIRYKEYYKLHKADYAKRTKKWQADNPEKLKESTKKTKAKYKEIGRDHRNEIKRTWAANNREKVRGFGRNFYKNNAEDLKNRVTKWRNDNLEKTHKYSKKWRQENPGKQNAKTARRRAAKLQATPKWLTEKQKQQIEVFYIEAARLTRETGIPHEVDHIRPLQGKNSNGLHVPWNMQILTQVENARKNNKEIT
jgi:hypothetical protein